MPLVGTPNIRFTAKTGITLTGAELATWTDQLSSEVLSNSDNRPQVGQEALNGVDVVSFNPGEWIQTVDSTYARNANDNNETVIEMVMKTPLTDTGALEYITDSEDNINRNAIVIKNTGVALRNSVTTTLFSLIPANEWGLLRVVFADASGTGRAKIYWNNELLWEDTSDTINSASGNGMTWGSRAPGGDDGDMLIHAAEIVEYANQAPQTEAGRIQNAEYYETEWDLTLLPVTTLSGTVKDEADALIEGAKTIWLSTPDVLGDGAIAEQVLSDAQGVHALDSDLYDATKGWWGFTRFAEVVESGTATGGTTTTLEDTNKNWTADEHITAEGNRMIKFTSGLNDTLERQITTNANQEATLNYALPNPVANGDTYEIWEIKAEATQYYPPTE